MRPAIDTRLGRELREHTAGHPGCKGCPEYLAIARRHTEPRIIWQGPTASHSRLSVQESR